MGGVCDASGSCCRLNNKENATLEEFPLSLLLSLFSVSPVLPGFPVFAVRLGGFSFSFFVSFFGEVLPVRVHPQLLIFFCEALSLQDDVYPSVAGKTEATAG